MDDIVIYAKVENKKISIKQMEAKDFKQEKDTVYYVMIPSHMRKQIDVLSLQFGNLSAIGVNMQVEIPVMFVGIGKVHGGKLFVENPVTGTEMTVPEGLGFFITPPRFED